MASRNEIAHRLGVGESWCRWVESQGLCDPFEETSQETYVGRISLIRACRESGLSLQRIRTILEQVEEVT